MSIKSKFTMENLGMYTAFAFYVIVGIVCFVMLPIANFPPHIGIIGILSLITAYGLFKKRGWTIWLVVILFFTATAHSTYTIYPLIGKDIIRDTITIAYLILTWVFTAYVAAKRKTLES